jgi:D-alanyl-D-alanine carboxypeptidase
MGNFYSEVISLDARFCSSNCVDDPALLEPVTRQLVQRLLAMAQNIGTKLMIYETYRSQQRQQELFNNGAARLRFAGVHHYGLACDIVRSVNGEPSWKGDFSLLGKLAQSCGLIWGGDWGAPQIQHHFVDSVHVQRCAVARQNDLFAGVWYPEEAYDPYADEHLLIATRSAPVASSPIQSEKSAGSA